MKDLKGCFSHNSDEWCTPSFLYYWFVDHCGYFDPCPTNHQEDGLAIEWPKNVFCNPPYSQISKWVDKAIIEHKKNYESHILLLVPVRTDTKWFRRLYNHCSNIKFITGRLHFNDKGCAPFSSMLVSLYFGGGEPTVDLTDLSFEREFYESRRFKEEV